MYLSAQLRQFELEADVQTLYLLIFDPNLPIFEPSFLRMVNPPTRVPGDSDIPLSKDVLAGRNSAVMRVIYHLTFTKASGAV